MINFSGVPQSKWLGRALRLPLRLIPKNAKVRILQGPLRGKYWISGSSDHGCWLGSYEAAKQRKAAELVRPGMICWDIGANVGFYTLLLAELVGRTGRVYAFEPLSRNREVLQSHVEMNGYSNVKIIPSALGRFDGDAEFDPGPNNSMGRLVGGGVMRVACVMVDTLFATGHAEIPDLVKIDIEGGEADLLTAGHTLLEHHPLILLATHNADANHSCRELLTAHGYEIQAVGDEAADVCHELVATYPFVRRSRSGGSH